MYSDRFGLGKAKRLKQAKEEAQDEIEKYRKERERQFREFEAKHMGSREDVAARIEQDTLVRIGEMNKQVAANKEPVSTIDYSLSNAVYLTNISLNSQVIQEILALVYDIKPEIHKNYRQ